MHTVDLDRLRLRPRNRLLDIGCGNGRHCAAAYQYEQMRVFGADMAFEDLKQAEQRLHTHFKWGLHGDGCRAFNCADVTRLPFADKVFDQVICAEVLEHVPDHRRAVAEIYRVLKAGGILAVSVPRRWPERICWKLAPDYGGQLPGHIRIYREADLRKLIAAQGFVFQGRHFAHALHTPYWWLKCLLDRHREDLWPARCYHRFLTWQIMQQPRWLNALEGLLNPLLGKSVVLYFTK